MSKKQLDLSQWEYSVRMRWCALLLRAVPEEERKKPFYEEKNTNDLIQEIEAQLYPEDVSRISRHSNITTDEGAIHYYITEHWSSDALNFRSCFEIEMVDLEFGRAVIRNSPPWMFLNTLEPSRRFQIADRMPWEVRERTRMAYNFYMMPPWDLHPKPGHYVHIARDDLSKVAYTPSPEYGARNRKIRLRPGRYLQQFYPDLGPKVITELASRMDGNYEVKFAVTPDEIERVYTTGPNSCMSAHKNQYESSEHPVRVYGDSDLHLAYLVKDGKAEPLARVLVWPEKMKIGRIYGDYHRLKYMLENLGYDTEDATGNALVGARIRRIQDEKHDALIMPYIDGPQRYSIVDANYVKIGGIGCASLTCGLDTDPEELGGREACHCCEERYDEDEMFQVYHSERERYLYCESCRNEEAQESDLSGRYIYHEEVASVHVRRTRGDRVEIWAGWEAENRARMCSGLEAYAFGYEMIELYDGDTVSELWFRENGVYATFNGKRIACDKHDLPAGAVVEEPTPEPTPEPAPELVREYFQAT